MDQPSSGTPAKPAVAPPAEGPASAAVEPPQAVTPSPEAPRISIDEFFKIELRVGKVVAAEAVPKSRKLIKIQLETGEGERQVLAGILGAYQPEELVGRTVVFVANLKPAKLAGLESNGMILAASGPDGGKPVLLTVEDPESAPPGSKVS